MIAVGFNDEPEDFPIALVTQHGTNAMTIAGAKVIAHNLLMIIDLLEKQACTTNE